MKTIKEHPGTRFIIQPNDKLRERESEALVWLLEGKSAAEAGIIMGTTERTQKAHRQRAMTALGANNAPSLVALAFYHKIASALCMLIIALQVSMIVQPHTLRRPPRPPAVRMVRAGGSQSLRELAGIRT